MEVWVRSQNHPIKALIKSFGRRHSVWRKVSGHAQICAAEILAALAQATGVNLFNVRKELENQ